MKFCLGSCELLLGREDSVNYFFFLYFLQPKYILSGSSLNKFSSSLVSPLC